jgi:homoserine dehydrogenase
MESQSSSAGIALVGCGTVGSSTASLLIENRVRRTSRSGIDLELKYIVDRNFEHARSAGLPEELYCEDLEKALSDPKVSMVIELVGGTGFAKELILRALNAGKHVITANKALLAHHGAELYRVARERGVSLAFEASCGGGIPIIRALTDGLMANEIDALYGIVNGTCNYILTEMIEQGQSYAEALAEAQASGLAEADPTLDVNGSDSAHKIAIMGSLAFGESADIDKIPVQGIDTLEATDVNFGAEMGYIIKLIASAIKSEEGIFLRVEPAFIPEDHPLAWVSGSFNAVSVYGHRRWAYHVLRSGGRGEPNGLCGRGRCDQHRERKLSPAFQSGGNLARPDSARPSAPGRTNPPPLLSQVQPPG